MRPISLKWRFIRSLGTILLFSLSVLADETDYLFKSTNLTRIDIVIPDSAATMLAQSRREPRPQVLATVTERGTKYTNVSLHLKGRGTYQPIHRRPSLTLNFAKEVKGQRFHGLKKISLNNSAQDPTLLQEKIARELFLAAGVPAARADHALVTLNGRELGVYVLTEGYDKTLLKRHFKDNEGPFFDGGLFTDVDRRLEAVTGDKTNYTGLQRAYRATLEPDPVARFAAIERAVQMDRFISLIAMETILVHFDGYAMRRTNYRVYHDPESDRLVFMPQGMDRILGNFRQHLDLPVVPPMVGLVARALIDTEQGRKMYVDRLRTLFQELFHEDELVERVRTLDRKIAAAAARPGNRWTTDRWNLHQVVSKGTHQQDVDDLCDRIQKRAALLRSYLAELEQPLARSPLLSFETNFRARPTGWAPRAAYLTSAAWEQVSTNQSTYWHVQTPGPYTALGCRFRLPAGTYHVAGNVKVSGTNGVPRVMLRHFFAPFQQEYRPIESEQIGFELRIPEGPALEEVDLLVEIRGAGEAWINPASFRVSRLDARN